MTPMLSSGDGGAHWPFTVARVGPRTASSLALLACLLGPVAGAQAVEPLVVRVSDAAGSPDGEIAVVLRTYGSRGVGQGQIGLRPRPQGGLRAARSAAVGGAAVQPLAELLEVVVFAANGDASVTSAEFDPSTQLALVAFLSPSGSINQLAGPLAMLRFRLADDVVPGEEYVLELELDASAMSGPGGESVELELRPGELTIRPLGALRLVEADGDRFVPGDVAVAGVATEEVFAIGSGSIGLRFDPSILVGPAAVTMDPRYGATIWSASFPEPGLVVVSFTALAGDPGFGTVPGNLVELLLPTSACLESGLISPVTVDLASTALVAPGGGAIAIEVENGELELEQRGLGEDDFETADLRFWCAVVP